MFKAIICDAYHCQQTLLINTSTFGINDIVAIHQELFFMSILKKIRQN